MVAEGRYRGPFISREVASGDYLCEGRGMEKKTTMDPGGTSREEVIWVARKRDCGKGRG